MSKKTGKTLDGVIENLEHSANCQLSDLQNYISFKSGTEWIKVGLEDIDWIEAVGDYMGLHLHSEPQNGGIKVKSQQIIRKTMKQLEADLDNTRVPRGSRAAMINVCKLDKLTPNSNGEYYAHLKCGTTIKVSRKYKYKLDELRRKNEIMH